MSTELMTVPTGEFDENAAMSRYGTNEPTGPQLARIKVLRDNVENAEGDIVAPMGRFALTNRLNDGVALYAKKPVIRLYETMMHYKRYDETMTRKNKDGETVEGGYVHSVMATNADGELMDDAGGYNCGRPAGYIQNWKELPEATQKLYNACKKTLHVFGAVWGDFVDGEGNKVTIAQENAEPFEMELAKSSHQKWLTPLRQMTQQRKVVQGHPLSMTTKRGDGSLIYYVVTPLWDESVALPLDEPFRELYRNFAEYVKAYNTRVKEAHKAIRDSAAELAEQEADTAAESEMIDLAGDTTILDAEYEEVTE